MNSTTNLNFFEEIQKVYFPNEIIFNLIISFFYGLLISFVYKKTHALSKNPKVVLIDLGLLFFHYCMPFSFYEMPYAVRFLLL